MVHIPNIFNEGKCGYCSTNFENQEVESQWDELDEQNHHYKSVSCNNCSKKSWVKADFIGSGHDSGIEEEESIESMIRKVQEGKND